MITEVNIEEKFGLIREYWTPKIIAELNGQQVKLAKIKDELIWHSHQDEDEMFIVFKGTLFMDFTNKTTETKKGEILIIPKGVEHRPRTNGEEVWIMLIEPKEIKHTGDIEHEKTVKEFEWI
ncbi:MAG: cupin domain-containing protein [Bacteroidota bacterium]|nr:cupin domain-containing protein [Bacteroidota bacterium]